MQFAAYLVSWFLCFSPQIITLWSAFLSRAKYSSHLRDAQALTCLFMLLATASLIAMILGLMLVRLGQRASIDWHDHRGLSFLQLGLRQLHTLLYQQKTLPILQILPRTNPPPSCASIAIREKLDFRIEFARVTIVSSWDCPEFSAPLRVVIKELAHQA